MNPNNGGMEKILFMHLKKEIAISPISPHCALFISEGRAGAEHDFKIYQSRVPVYNDYLKMKRTETQQTELHGRKYWDLLADKGLK